MGLHHGFGLKCLFTLKIGLTLANSDRATCTNMFSSNSDGWHLAMQAFFTKNSAHSTVWSFREVVLMRYRKMEESIKMPKSTYKTIFWIADHLRRRAEIHLLPVHDIHTHALSRNIKY